MKSALVILAAQSAIAFPFVTNVAGVDKRTLAGGYPLQKRNQPCPVNPVHPGAVPINDKFPYLGAVNGSRGTGKGGILVPAAGDTAHAFEAAGPLDIRGPCPGLNTMANHHFISHDGLTTYNELVDAQQNVFNIGYDLANLLATAGVRLDGDLVTDKLSIGCARDDYTNVAPGVGGTEPGLDGHNKFEADTSLTRQDFFLGKGDDYTFHGDMFKQMADICQDNFDRNNLAYYRALRYNESRATNPDFFFGPGTLLMYGAASFLYGSFASGGLKGKPDLATEMSFFGAEKNSDGSYSFNGGERIPDNWINSVQPYDNGQIGPELFSMYALYPVQFGANIGSANNFNAMNVTGYMDNGFLTLTTPQHVMCFVYQLVTAGFPATLSNVYLVPADAIGYAAGKLLPAYKNLGCPSPLYPSDLPVIGTD